MNIRPGATAQLLHRDDMTWQQHHADRVGCYKKESEVSVAALIPGVEFTEANGATRVNPSKKKTSSLPQMPRLMLSLLANPRFPFVGTFQAREA